MPQKKKAAKRAVRTKGKLTRREVIIMYAGGTSMSRIADLDGTGRASIGHLIRTWDKQGCDRPRRRFSDIEAAYIAGIIDGEGSVGSQQRANCQFAQVLVQVNMTDKATMEWLAHVINAGCLTRVVPKQRRKDGTRRKTFWRLAVSGRPAVEFLEEIRPWMITKKKRASRAIARYRDQH